MLVNIRARHDRLGRSLKQRVERRFGVALAKFGGRIRSISAFLEDINGPRGGEDQRCGIEVTLVPSGSIMAEATDVGVVPAVGRAVERVARRVRNALDRKRTMRMRKRNSPHEDSVAPESY